MWRIYIALDSWDVSVDDLRSLSGVLCWASKVIEYGMIYVRELYSVVAELGLSSCPKSIGRSTFIGARATNITCGFTSSSAVGLHA